MVLRDLLVGKPGFPDVRLRWSPDPESCHVVEWGARTPFGGDDVLRGRFYGYREEVLGQF